MMQHYAVLNTDGEIFDVWRTDQFGAQVLERMYPTYTVVPLDTLSDDIVESYDYWKERDV